MLLPFDERLASLASFPLDYLGCVTRDAANERLNGVLLVCSESQARGVLYENGQARAIYGYDGTPRLLRGGALPGAPFAGLSELVGIELFRLDAGMSAMAWRFAAREPLWRMRQGDLPELLCAASGERLNGVLGRYGAGYLDLAYVVDGELVFGYAFDSSAGAFRRSPAGFWQSAGQDETPCEFVSVGPLAHPAPDFSGQADALALSMERYRLLLSRLTVALHDLLGQSADGTLARVVDDFKRKYPPLYRGVYLNPETGEVNWEQILANREKVKRKYRYDKFLLYADEVLLQMVNVLRERGGEDGVARFRAELLRVSQLETENERPYIQFFHNKLAQLARKFG